MPGTAVDCFWLKDVQAAGCITDDIIDALSEAAFGIADVTGHDPNVMCETGYAMAPGKPTILIGQDIATLSFDLKSHSVLEYPGASPERISDTLSGAVRQTPARYEPKGQERPNCRRPRGRGRSP